MIRNSDDKTNFPHKLLLTNRHVSNLRRDFANNLLTYIKLLKAQLSKIIQSGVFFGWLLGPLLKTSLPLIYIFFYLRVRNNDTNSIKWRNGRYYGNS